MIQDLFQVHTFFLNGCWSNYENQAVHYLATVSCYLSILIYLFTYVSGCLIYICLIYVSDFLSAWTFTCCIRIYHGVKSKNTFTSFIPSKHFFNGKIFVFTGKRETEVLIIFPQGNWCVNKRKINKTSNITLHCEKVIVISLE